MVCIKDEELDDDQHGEISNKELGKVGIKDWTLVGCRAMKIWIIIVRA